MSYSNAFVTHKRFIDGCEVINIKYGNIPNTSKILLAKRKKREKKKRDYENILPNGQLSFDYMKKYESLKTELDLKYSPKLNDAVRSMYRSKNNLLDILRNNDFNFFVTLTFNNNLIDRLNDEITRKSFTQWVANISRTLPNIKYVAVPEYHKKGGLHFHLLVGGVSNEDLKLIDSGKVVKKGRCKGQVIYICNRWGNKGFSTVTEILDNNAVKFYLSKYLSKTKVDPRFFNKKRFYFSRNVIRPSIFKFSIPLVENFDIFDYYSKSHFNIDYEDIGNKFWVLSNYVKEK